MYLSQVNLFRQDRAHTTGGGVCVYLDDKIPCKLLNSCVEDDVESIWLSMRPYRLPRQITSIILSVIWQIIIQQKNKFRNVYRYVINTYTHIHILKQNLNVASKCMHKYACFSMKYISCGHCANTIHKANHIEYVHFVLTRCSLAKSTTVTTINITS
jgi:hypothetical protein